MVLLSRSRRISAVSAVVRSGSGAAADHASSFAVPAKPPRPLESSSSAKSSRAFEAVVAAVPDEVGGAQLETEIVRLWPGLDSTEATAPLLQRATGVLGRPVIGMERGGASDASHVAAVVPITVDGLGPRGGGAHSPGEYVLADSLHSRAEVALAIAAALLGDRLDP